MGSLAELNAYLRKRCVEDRRQRVRGQSGTKAELLKVDQAASRPLPVAPFEACRRQSTRSSALSLVRFDNNDYSVPVSCAHHPVVVKGFIDEVVLCARGVEVARHRRRWEAEEIAFDPVYYLALLERKPGALDAARPLAEWKPPECFALLRRRLESGPGAEGTRECIRALRLLEIHAVDRLAKAMNEALEMGATSRDLIAQLLRPREDYRATLFGLDGHPHLRGVRVAAPDLRGYGTLVTAWGGAQSVSTTTLTASVLLEHHLKALKLPTFLREYKSVAAACEVDKADYPGYLLRLAERELIGRKRKAAERRLKEAGFPVVKTLETFQFAACVSINEALVRLLIRGDYLEKKENILLVGNPGTGKSHLATALGFAACQDGRVKFTSVSALVTQMLELREQRSPQRLHKQLDRLDLLILDELGHVPFSKAGAELLFDVVSRAYERTSLIVTTNLPFENWTEVLGSERLTGALLDRLTPPRAHPGSQRRQLPPGRRQETPQGPVRPHPAHRPSG